MWLTLQLNLLTTSPRFDRQPATEQLRRDANISAWLEVQRAEANAKL